jgi:hypothetical protein
VARWRKDRQLLAALLILTGAEGCGMTETNAEAKPAAHGAAVFDVAEAFLTAADPVALIRSRGAKIDERFAANGSYSFEAPQIAARGSTLSVPKGEGPTTLTLVLPGETTLRLDDATARLGEATRLPALPGKAWQYGIPVSGGGRVVVVLTGDPTASSTRVTRLTIIRAH